MSYLALSAITVCNFLQSFSPPSLSLSARCSVAFCCQNCQPGSRFYLPRARFSLFLALPLWLFHEKQPFAQIHKWWRWRVGGGKRRQKFPSESLTALTSHLISSLKTFYSFHHLLLPSSSAHWGAQPCCLCITDPSERICWGFRTRVWQALVRDASSASLGRIRHKFSLPLSQSHYFFIQVLTDTLPLLFSQRYSAAFLRRRESFLQRHWWEKRSELTVG